MYTQWDVLKGFSHLLATTGIFYVHKVASMLTGTSDVLRGICKVNTAKEEVKAEMEDYIRWRYIMAQKEGVRQRWMENKMESEKKRAAELNEKKNKNKMEWWYYYPPGLKPPWLISYLSPPFLFEIYNCLQKALKKKIIKKNVFILSSQVGFIVISTIYS